MEDSMYLRSGLRTGVGDIVTKNVGQTAYHAPIASGPNPDDIVDGFLYSTTLRLLPTQYRAHALAQMEVLRRSGGYKFRMFVSPDSLVNPIAAYSQVETQSRMAPGTLIWGISVYLSTTANVKIQITDKCTEIAIASDYISALLFTQTIPAAGFNIASTVRAPTLFSQPRLIDSPGQVNVEIYNDNPDPLTAQVCLYCAEPVTPNPDVYEANNREYERGTL
jgi:hypothetical protein